jgi:cell pole-organizing protein PopZ
MNKTAFIVSVALTAFVLMMVGGIVYTVHASDKAQQAAISSTPTASQDPSTPAVDPALVQAINQREAAYQQLIAEANARLAQAQQQEQALQAQLVALQATNAPAPSQNVITPQQAASIASNSLGQTSVYSVETVSMQGQNLYKVTFSSGDIVYVSMDGQVAGTVIAKQSTSSNTLAASGGHGENEPEHESHGHDD